MSIANFYGVKRFFGDVWVLKLRYGWEGGKTRVIVMGSNPKVFIAA